jgi:hypothetical protein
MHHLLRTSIILGLLASVFLIYAVQSASIMAVNTEVDYTAKNCSPAGADCGAKPPCCNPKCRVNWGGAWCT